MAQYKYLDYDGLSKLSTILKDKFSEISNGTNVKVDWDNILNKPDSYTPSAHTQSYTTLTGSSTVKDQAIVSSGVENGWALKTLGDNAFNSTVIPTQYAGSDSAGGVANSAKKLSTGTTGSATNPVYFKDGVPTECDDMATQAELNTVKTDLETAINNHISSAMSYMGTLGTGGTITSLPSTSKQGHTYKIITAGTYSGQVCEVGDMIICVKGGEGVTPEWSVIQNNIDLVGEQNSIGLIKNGSNVTSISGLIAVPIIKGVPYYKDTTYDSLKNPYALTLKFKNTSGTDSSVSYDGSETKSFDLSGGIYYAETAGTAGKLSTGTTGSTTKPVYFSNGVPTECNDMATQEELNNVDTSLKNLPWHKTSGKATGTATTTATDNPAINARTNTSGKFYGVEQDANGKMYVNVPWTDNNDKVAYTATTTNSTYPLLFASTANKTNNNAEGVRYSTNLKYNPNTKALSGVDSLVGFDSTLSAVVDTSAAGTDASVSMLVSVTQDEGKLSAGTCVTFTKITDDEITGLFS